MAAREANMNHTTILGHHPQPPNPTPDRSPFRNIILVASIAAGIQFGWALQLSLLTPYVQLLGIPHTWAAFIWLCGPVSGMLVQPAVGYYSDRCRSRFGRRRPFIAAGAVSVAIAVFLIGYAADLGFMSGDLLVEGVPKVKAIAIFVVGFSILDVANNVLQSPCRAFLADLSGKDERLTALANALFSFFMAIGNVLGYAAGAYNDLHKIFPFTQTRACDVYCANLKSCFFLAIALLTILTTLALSLVRDKPLPEIEQELANERGEVLQETGKSEPFWGELFMAIRKLKKPMWFVLLVTCLNWIAWFPFVLYDTDWMGHEVYGGKVGEGSLYDLGVRAGALGLMLNSVALGVMSLGTQYIGRKLGGQEKLWGFVNLFLAVCMSMTVLVTKMAEAHRVYDAAGNLLPPRIEVKAGALSLFALLGIPLAITYSVPFSLTSIFSNSAGAGQALSLGILNLSIVVPQMLISLTSGPWDALFGGGNLPAFVVGAVAAAVSGILALTVVPSPPQDAIPRYSGGCFF